MEMREMRGNMKVRETVTKENKKGWVEMEEQMKKEERKEARQEQLQKKRDIHKRKDMSRWIKRKSQRQEKMEKNRKIRSMIITN